MKILSATQIRETDAFTINNEPVSALTLMERAAGACALRIAEITPPKSKYLIICGKGNNGGDGLTIARLLAGMHRMVSVAIVNHSDKESACFTENLKRLADLKTVDIRQINSANELGLLKEDNLFIIDALLGTGVNKTVGGLLADVITLVNGSYLPVISIDMPSGLPCDEKPQHKNIIKAHKTLSFQRPKLTFMFTDFAGYVGGFEILDIGLDENFIELQKSEYSFFVEKDALALLQPRARFSHKGHFGHALLLAGSKGKMGAAVLAARACLRAGAGLLTAHVPACGTQVLQTAVPEAMVSEDENSDFITSYPHKQSFAVAGAGPGIGTESQTAAVIKQLIQNCDSALVLDADALNIISENKTWLAFLPSNTILTPHPKEFDRLGGAHSSDFDRLQTCRDFAFKNGCIVVLKGAFTAIVMPDRKVFFNGSGNPALAKGGSGDVLTGIILGLLSSGYPPEQAALLGVFIHGHAADLYIKNNSEQSMLATDLIELLPKAFHL